MTVHAISNRMGKKIDFEILYWFNRIKSALSGPFYKNAI